MKNKNNNAPSIFIILGADGDLSSKKILPSLWHLFQHDLLPEKLSVLGFSRNDFSDENFRAFIRDTVQKHGGMKADEKDIVRFLSFFSFHKGTFENKEAFLSLAERIAEIESSWSVCANKLFYLAVPPSSYRPIFEHLAKAKLNLPCGGEIGWSRILIEKPFGTDIETSRNLQKLLSSYFKEEQIYRIDHYLAKEIIQGVENFRFSNNLFEKTWDNTTIERIDIRLLETIGAEDRGNFYDAIGALRDVGQNHLLMMLAAVTMEYSADMKANFVRKSRVHILEALKEWTEETIRKNTFRSQYRGYETIKGVKPNSETETYFALRTEIDSPRWKGVPVFLEAGKRASKEARKEIVLTLKNTNECLLCETGADVRNRIVFRLEPNDEIIIHFWMKKPGFERVLEERTFSFFLYEKETKMQYVEEYAKLLHSAIVGDQALFVSREEVEALWKFTDPITLGWNNGFSPLAKYEPGTIPEHPDFGLSECARSKLIEKQIGIVGLGKMGANLSRRFSENGWRVVGFDKSAENLRKLAEENITENAKSLSAMVSELSPRRIVWLMIPSGDAVDDVIFGKGGLAEILSVGDIIIDGGNSFFRDSIQRAEKLKSRGIHFLDVGVSGGPAGAKNGPCLMIGGEKAVFQDIEFLFQSLALPGGYQFFEGHGAGHFVKMVHNGIEYGMMQSIAEGFDVMKHSEYKLDLSRIADLYNHGSVIESRLIKWLFEAFEMYGTELNGLSGTVAHSGEGAWKVETAKKMNIPTKIIEASLQFRKDSEKNPSYAGKILTALRNRFGGHAVAELKK